MPEPPNAIMRLNHKTLCGHVRVNAAMCGYVRILEKSGQGTARRRRESGFSTASAAFRRLAVVLGGMRIGTGEKGGHRPPLQICTQCVRGLRQAIIMRSEIALFRILSLYGWPATDLRTCPPVKRTKVFKWVPNRCGNLPIVRLRPRLPALSAFARLSVGKAQVLAPWGRLGNIFTT